MDTFEAADGITAIDTRMAGRRTVTSAYLLAGPEPTLIETGPTTSVEAVTAGLTTLGMGPEDLAHVVVTHIHLDHAGGVGSLAERFPRATVWVHHRGAPHLADPTKLVQSAARVYGEERLRQLFGPVDPVDADRLRSMDDGDRITLGGRYLDVVHTPGHASHQVALIDSQTGALFAGDALGIHLPDVGVLRPVTPPPEIDVEAAVASIGLIRDRATSLLMFSHFGPVDDPDAIRELCSLAAHRLVRWADIVREGMDRTEDLGEIATLLRTRTADDFAEVAEPDAATERYELLATMEMNTAGLVRYWRKREECEALS
ncbi:MAG TPA: MBL fold metallo-hydrolase [Actinomycetota bacterium]|nr:MBL fold metallo-hydrolase [Actinomycetota bacterium]